MESIGTITIYGTAYEVLDILDKEKYEGNSEMMAGVEAIFLIQDEKGRLKIVFKLKDHTWSPFMKPKSLKKRLKKISEPVINQLDLFTLQQTKL